MADKDFIIEEPETLELEPKEEILTFDVPTKAVEPKETLEQPVVSPSAPVNEPVVQPNPEPPVQQAQPVYNIVPPSVADARVNKQAQSQVSQINTQPQSVEVPKVEPQVTETLDVTSAQSETQPKPINEETVIKEVTTAAPNKINDDILKVEDTLLTNNLKEDINKVVETKDEETQNKKALSFIIVLFVLLGLTILLLPFLSNIFLT